jgi:peptide/nickel transport system permease protein
VVVETVFGWPGLGQLAFRSVLRRDYPVVLGILFFASLMVIVSNILTDLAYKAVDPRVESV